MSEDLKKMKKLAYKGDVKAQFNLGVIYYKGDGVEQDYPLACYWFEESANKGYAKAQYNLGLMYYHGGGVKQNYKQAMYWYEKVAYQHGLKEAQYMLGLMHYNGQGIKKDYRIAFDFYEKSAYQGLKEAQYNLGYMYHLGEGVEQDYEKALEWYTKSAKKGDAYAQYNLGVMYYKGDGIEQDYKKALEWFLVVYKNSQSLSDSKRFSIFMYLIDLRHSLDKDAVKEVLGYGKGETIMNTDEIIINQDLVKLKELADNGDEHAKQRYIKASRVVVELVDRACKGTFSTSEATELVYSLKDELLEHELIALDKQKNEIAKLYIINNAFTMLDKNEK